MEGPGTMRRFIAAWLIAVLASGLWSVWENTGREEKPLLHTVPGSDPRTAPEDSM